MRAVGLGAALAALALAPGAAEAQVVCRPNALGAEICTGLAPAAPGRSATFGRQGRGLSRSLPALPERGPALVGRGGADALGETVLTGRELPPPRPLPGVAPVRACARDALGNLVCR